MCRVVNKYKEEYDVYIGRGSVWGNPFSHLPETKALFKVDTRDEAVASYKDYLWHQMKEGFITTDMLRSLNGKRLGCFCKPQSCHGDIIVKAVAWIMEKDNE
jgi:hypothetical protein